MQLDATARESAEAAAWEVFYAETGSPALTQGAYRRASEKLQARLREIRDDPDAA